MFHVGAGLFINDECILVCHCAVHCCGCIVQCRVGRQVGEAPRDSLCCNHCLPRPLIQLHSSQLHWINLNFTALNWHKLHCTVRHLNLLPFTQSQHYLNPGAMCPNIPVLTPLVSWQVQSGPNKLLELVWRLSQRLAGRSCSNSSTQPVWSLVHYSPSTTLQFSTVKYSTVRYSTSNYVHYM